MSYLSQIAALGFVMFISPATGIAVGIAFIRGLTGRPLGNFYVDLIRAITRVLLPICIVGAVLFIVAGVPETLSGPATVTTLEGATQVIARGPIAHFEIIKMLGENGGAYFGGNSAHPFENPNGASSLLQIVTMVCIAAAFIYTYGVALFNLFVQVIWGSEGTGTATLFIYLLLAVFLTGLMVGRTPEFLGRKIEQREITLVSVILLIHPLLVLIPSAITLAPDTLSGITNPGFHGLSQVVYEYASAAANNGSGFEGLLDSQPAPTALWWNLSTTVTLAAGRIYPDRCPTAFSRRDVPQTICTRNSCNIADGYSPVYRRSSWNHSDFGGTDVSSCFGIGSYSRSISTGSCTIEQGTELQQVFNIDYDL